VPNQGIENHITSLGINNHVTIQGNTNLFKMHNVHPLTSNYNQSINQSIDDFTGKSLSYQLIISQVNNLAIN
jgi:hypothetical protein